jgi:hypothetical protein
MYSQSGKSGKYLTNYLVGILQNISISATIFTLENFAKTNRFVNKHVLVKFMFCKKATKIDAIFTVDLTLCSKCDRLVGQYPSLRLEPTCYT